MKARPAIAEPGVAQPTVIAATPAALENRSPQRAQHRVAHRMPCRVRLIDALTGEVRSVAGETVNISAGGVALQIAVEVPLGTWVETLVPHAHGEPLFLCGTVVHVRRTMAANYEIGVAMSDDAPSPFA